MRPTVFLNWGMYRLGLIAMTVMLCVPLSLQDVGQESRGIHCASSLLKKCSVLPLNPASHAFVVNMLPRKSSETRRDEIAFVSSAPCMKKCREIHSNSFNSLHRQGRWGQSRALPPLQLLQRPQSQKVQALLNLKNGNILPDISGLSTQMMRTVGGLIGWQEEVGRNKKETTTLERRRQEQADKLVRAIEAEISRWVQKIGDLEDKRLAELNSALEEVYEMLNQKLAAPRRRTGTAFGQVRAVLRVWRALRRSTDPSTREFLSAMERIRRDYDDGIMTLTSTVQPLTEEEVQAGLEMAGARELKRAIDNGVDSAVTIQKDLETALQNSLQPLATGQLLDHQLDQELVHVAQGLQQAENQIRGGLERARYMVLQKTRRRQREAEAAYVSVRGGVVYAAEYEGSFEVPILEGLGEHMYVDDTDGSALFMGVKAPVEASQHVVKLGVLPATAGRWLSCARQKLWWMSPDVGGRLDPIPPETQFFLGETTEGMYYVLLPLVGSTFRSALWGTEGGGLSLRLESGDPKETDFTITTSLLIAAGRDPFKLLERAFAAVADRIGTFRVRSEKTLPASLDVFGWCTWDAFYSKVTPEGVKEGLSALIQGGTPARFLILDDGWQSTDNDAEFRVSESDAREQVDAAELAGGGVIEGDDYASRQLTSLVDTLSELAGGGVIEGDDYASRQLTSLADMPARLLTWWYKTVVDKSPYDSMPIKTWQWLTHNVFKHEMLKYFALATDWSKRLTSILPNQKFMRLRTLVKDVKEDYGLKYTYCWHALTGYWLGVDPTSPGMSRFNPVIQYPCISPHFDYTPGMLFSEPTMLWNPSSFVGMGLIPPTSIHAFYTELHQSLRDAGIDGVKVDAQAAITMLGVGYGGGPAITRAYVHAMEASVRDNMDGNCINCMCHPTENLYSYRDTAVARASDDFYPREAASHTVHVANVVYNSLFLGEIVQPDWDMFQSDHPAAALHAAARAVGGCAVYTSDRPGVHDFGLLRKLVLPDGSILRALLPGRPARDCLFADVCADGVTALKVWNRNPAGGVLGVFNIQGAWWDRSVRQFRQSPSPPTVLARMRPRDVEGLRSPAGKYAVWSHGERRLQVLAEEEEWIMTLRPQAADVLTVAPLQRLRGVGAAAAGGGEEEAVFAAVGLPEMLNGGGAILSLVVGRAAALNLQTLLQGVLDPVAGGGVGPAAAAGVVAEAVGPQDCLVALDSATCLVPELDTSTLAAAVGLAGAGGAPVSTAGGGGAGGGRTTVAMEVKGQGTLLCYSNVRPASARLRPHHGGRTGAGGASSAASSAGAGASVSSASGPGAAAAGAATMVDDAPAEWEYEPETGLIKIQLPPMTSTGPGVWDLNLAWDRRA